MRPRALLSSQFRVIRSIRCVQRVNPKVCHFHNIVTFVQEPYSNAELIQYAANNSYTYPFIAKTNVNDGCSLENGNSMATQCGLASSLCCPLNQNIYDYLKSVLPGTILWNYAKFLVGKDGCVSY